MEWSLEETILISFHPPFPLYSILSLIAVVGGLVRSGDFNERPFSLFSNLKYQVGASTFSLNPLSLLQNTHALRFS